MSRSNKIVAKADAPSKRITKKERLIALLKTKGGVTVAEISEKLDWQRHTTRAALTGLRKAGFTILAAKSDGGGVGHYSVSKTAARK